jgi:hypothetical protein
MPGCKYLILVKAEVAVEKFKHILKFPGTDKIPTQQIQVVVVVVVVVVVCRSET